LLQKSASGAWGATIESERASSWIKVANRRLILNQCCSPDAKNLFATISASSQPPCHAAEEAGRTGTLKTKRAVRLVVSY
jgi:hypothetical protein